MLQFQRLYGPLAQLATATDAAPRQQPAYGAQAELNQWVRPLQQARTLNIGFTI